MQDGAETRKRQGPVAVLAILVGLLLAYSPAAQAEVSSRSSGLTNPELVKAAKSVRSVSRCQGETAEADECVGAPPPVAGRVTIFLYALPQPVFADAAITAGPPAPAYRARAPPAA